MKRTAYQNYSQAQKNMAKNRQIIYSILGTAMISLLPGCNTNGCLENRSSIPKAGFYNGEDQKIGLDSVSITGVGVAGGEPINRVGTSISSISLPMRSTMDNTTWVLGYEWKYLGGGELTDTISFDYESTPYFASEECGVIYRYQITKMRYTTNLVDSVVLVDSLITNIDTEQIKIYFRTQTTDEN